ncbi:hypothetical protein [Blastomonas sp. AAP53]|uniref:hypothetical protein n=1 Tax=Blastomonas sp. AAP53 TaxID=1248760 RepID=UPI000317FAB8|nr:hypothetical protein [Blastomonas sp. AAP53]
MTNRPILSLELNELCAPLLDRWMADGSLPNFRRLHARSHVFETQADTHSPEELEPWIQWYSIHTGLSYDQHKVFRLTDGRGAAHRDIWQTVSDAGSAVMNFASMNARPFARPGSLYVGDPWSEQGDAFPPELNIYNRFVGHNVREYSNAAKRLSATDYAAFLRFALTHGLSAATVLRITSQLAGEKLGKAGSHARVAILDALQYDVFSHYYRRIRPRFASFFANSVAHLQHSYWRHMDPDSFTVKPGAEETARYKSAIYDGYVAMDAMVGRFIDLAEKHDAMIVFQTALSQQPFARYENQGGQHFLRLRDHKAFLARCGIVSRSADPTMTHQYMLRFDSQKARAAAKARLKAFTLADGYQVFATRDDGDADALYFGCQISWQIDAETAMTDTATGEAITIGSLLYAMEGVKSGCHSPSGSLWIATGAHVKHTQAVSILDIYPTMMDLMELPAPDADRRGHSLAGLLSARAAA